MLNRSKLALREAMKLDPPEVAKAETEMNKLGAKLEQYYIYDRGTIIGIKPSGTKVKAAYDKAFDKWKKLLKAAYKK